MGKIFGISKVAFEIPHKVSYPFIVRCVFYPQVKIKEPLDLRTHEHVFETPQGNQVCEVVKTFLLQFS